MVHAHVPEVLRTRMTTVARMGAAVQWKTRKCLTWKQKDDEAALSAWLGVEGRRKACRENEGHRDHGKAMNWWDAGALANVLGPVIVPQMQAATACH